MPIFQRIVCIALLLFSAVGAQAFEPGQPPPTRKGSSEGSGRYTAQHRPRVTVLTFDDANTEAQSARYGSSVEGMLVTFLKRQSQLIVVERQKLGSLLGEKQRMQRGMVNIDPDDPAARALLEKIDVQIFGKVTLLNIPSEEATAQKSNEKSDGPGVPPFRHVVQGAQIEVDAKLARLDGQIIAAAQGSGPVACLRGIVQRLGVALEQDFLRPYYGRLKLQLTEPDHVHISLTPILLDRALAEQKPPVESGSSITIGVERDHIEPWITVPTTYTIKNLLSGWYALSLERPGYEELGTDAARWVARDLFGKVEVYDRITGSPIASSAPELRRFVVRVDPSATAVIDGDALNFVFRKQGGSLAPRVKRQYLDTDFSQVPQRVILMGGKGLDLNQPMERKDFDEDQLCGLFEPMPFAVPNYGRTYIPAGQPFDIDKFKGGELIIEDYQGEVVPTGEYQLALWDSNYEITKSPAAVRDRDLEKVTRASLVRETQTFKLDATGPRSKNRVNLEGRYTHKRFDLPLDFSQTREQRGLPVDVYTVSTNIPGLDAWKESMRLVVASSPPPTYYTRSPAYEPKVSHPPEEDNKPVPSLTIKTRLALAGRLEVFSRPPDPLALDLFIDGEVPKIIDLLLHAGQQAAMPSGLPRDPDELRVLLARRLKVIDLLVLDPRDMAQLRKSPAEAAIVQRYLEEGGALFAFVAETGDYGEVVGAPLVIDAVSKPTDLFTLAPGDVAGFDLQLGKKVKVPSRRALPAVSQLPPQGLWRVLTFTAEREEPRIIERGRREGGGYVALWLDDPGSFRSRLGGTVPQVEVARAKLEERILQRARYLMYRRYDKGGAQRRKLEKTLVW